MVSALPLASGPRQHLLAEVLGGEGWAVLGLLEKMYSTPALYFDAASLVRMERWYSDEQCCWEIRDIVRPTLLTVRGTTLIMMGAYILIGKLKMAQGDHKLAVTRYE